MAGTSSGRGLFDAFEAELSRVRASHARSGCSTSELGAPSDFLEDVLDHYGARLAQGLANHIARPFLRRFTNRFLDVMLDDLRRRGRRRGMAGQVAFDVTLLAYLFHITSEAEALRNAKTLPRFLLGAAGRFLSGQPASVSAEARAHMDRRALPWINRTSGAFVLATRREGFTDDATARRLAQHFTGDSVLRIRDCRPTGRHPLGRHSIGECLSQPGSTGLADLLNKRYLDELVPRTHWQPASSLRTYHESPWALESYRP